MAYPPIWIFLPIFIIGPPYLKMLNLKSTSVLIIKNKIKINMSSPFKCLILITPSYKRSLHRIKDAAIAGANGTVLQHILVVALIIIQVNIPPRQAIIRNI